MIATAGSPGVASNLPSGSGGGGGGAGRIRINTMSGLSAGTTFIVSPAPSVGAVVLR